MDLPENGFGLLRAGRGRSRAGGREVRRTVRGIESERGVQPPTAIRRYMIPLFHWASEASVCHKDQDVDEFPLDVADSSQETAPPGRVVPRLSTSGRGSPSSLALATRGMCGRCPTFLRWFSTIPASVRRRPRTASLRLARLGTAAFAFFMLAALEFPLPAEAQTVTEFVLRSSQGFSPFPSSYGLDRLQRLTMGSHPGGYTLGNIRIGSVDPVDDAFAVSLCAVDSRGFPVGWPM